MSYLNRLPLLAVLSCLLLAPGALAQGEVRISELSYLDRQFMSQQRQLIDDLVRRNFGGQIRREKHNDLVLLQQLLDRELVRPADTRALQAMGIVMGDLLAIDLDMHWVIYEDRVGRSRALRYKQSDNYLFPVTMIARRREADNRSSVRDIYQKAYDIIEPLRDPLPFQ